MGWGHPSSNRLLYQDGRCHRLYVRKGQGEMLGSHLETPKVHGSAQKALSRPVWSELAVHSVYHPACHTTATWETDRLACEGPTHRPKIPKASQFVGLSWRGLQSSTLCQWFPAGLWDSVLAGSLERVTVSRRCWLLPNKPNTVGGNGPHSTCLGTCGIVAPPAGGTALG